MTGHHRCQPPPPGGGGGTSFAAQDTRLAGNPFSGSGSGGFRLRSSEDGRMIPLKGHFPALARGPGASGGLGRYWTPAKGVRKPVGPPIWGRFPRFPRLAVRGKQVFRSATLGGLSPRLPLSGFVRTFMAPSTPSQVSGASSSNP